LPSARTSSRPVRRGSGGMEPTVGGPCDSQLGSWTASPVQTSEALRQTEKVKPPAGRRAPSATVRNDLKFWRVFAAASRR